MLKDLRTILAEQSMRKKEHEATETSNIQCSSSNRSSSCAHPLSVAERKRTAETYLDSWPPLTRSSRLSGSRPSHQRAHPPPCLSQCQRHHYAPAAAPVNSHHALVSSALPWPPAHGMPAHVQTPLRFGKFCFHHPSEQPCGRGYTDPALAPRRRSPLPDSSHALSPSPAVIHLRRPPRCCPYVW
jgi:hypothetical protein